MKFAFSAGIATNLDEIDCSIFGEHEYPFSVPNSWLEQAWQILNYDRTDTSLKAFHKPPRQLETKSTMDSKLSSSELETSPNNFFVS